jgi:hypothetical protein
MQYPLDLLQSYPHHMSLSTQKCDTPPEFYRALG